MSDGDTITLPREVVQEALEAFEAVRPFSTTQRELKIRAVEALRTALAAPRLEVTVDPRLTAEEAAAISAAIDARKKEQSEDIEALRRDAERYRWLRNRACHGPHERFVAEYGWFDVSGQHEPGFDAAIDAAMEGGKR